MTENKNDLLKGNYAFISEAVIIDVSELLEYASVNEIRRTLVDLLFAYLCIEENSRIIKLNDRKLLIIHELLNTLEEIEQQN